MSNDLGFSSDEERISEPNTSRVWWRLKYQMDGETAYTDWCPNLRSVEYLLIQFRDANLGSDYRLQQKRVNGVGE